ncbi:MAG TPA: tetratricopeptide repeat protein [Gemmatimonadaceae bacterium]|nr:tetratricopeptide repeat protein [Gemmatimonadaceae bacterium]
MSSSARIEELRKKFDENPRRYFAPLANEYRKAGDFDQAIFICQEYLPQQPGHMSGHIVFGQALFEAKRLPEAKTVFETALSLDPENLIALRHLADISRDLGDTAAARTWYERVLHADPRNEEIAAIMETLGSDTASATAPTAETPAIATPEPAPSASAATPASPARTMPDASSAPTVVLSAAAVQEMLKARMAGRAPAPAPEPVQKPVQEPVPEVELLTLDTASTVEINQVNETPTIDGLEPTSQAPAADMPAFEALGLETNMAPGQQPDATPATASLEGLDTTSLDISFPSATPVAPTLETPAMAAEPEPAAAGDDGLLDLGSFSFGESPAAAAPVTAPSAAETPIDGGHDAGLELLDLDLPGAPEPEHEPEPAPVPALEELSMPTMIIETVKSVAPAVQDAVQSAMPMVMDAMESAAPAMMDFVDTTIPSVIDAVQEVVPAVVQAVAETPTVIMEAMRAEPPEVIDEPPATEPAREPRPSQQVPIITETMAQLYLSQGHRDEAIDIYRKLIESRPGDSELRARLAAIEIESSTPAPRPQEPAPQPARRFTGSGPSIRTVLRDLFGLTGEAASNGAFAGAAGEIGSIDMLFSASSVADALSPLAVAFDGGYVAAPGDIDALFAEGNR